MLDKVRIASIISRLVFIYLHYILLLQLGMKTLNQSMAGFLEIALIGGMLIISYVVRERITTMIGIIIVHALMAAGVFFLISAPEPKWILIILFMTESINAARYIGAGYMLRKEFDLPWPSFLLFIFILIIGLAENYRDLLNLCFVMSIAIYMVYILILYLQNVEEYIKASRNISGIPLKKIIPLNTVIVLSIFTAMGVSVVLADMLGFPDAVFEFVKAIVRVLFIGFKIIAAIFAFIASLFTAGGDTEKFKRDMLVVNEMVDDSSIFGAIADFLLKLLIIIIVVILIVRFFRKIYEVLMAKRARHAVDSVIRLKKSPIRKNEVESLKKEKENVTVIEQRARRIYKKRVGEVRKKYVPDNNHTTADIKYYYTEADKLLKPENPGDISVVTELYEAVRYGDAVPDSEMLRKMRNS